MVTYTHTHTQTQESKACAKPGSPVVGKAYLTCGALPPQICSLLSHHLKGDGDNCEAADSGESGVDDSPCCCHDSYHEQCFTCPFVCLTTTTASMTAVTTTTPTTTTIATTAAAITIPSGAVPLLLRLLRLLHYYDENYCYCCCYCHCHCYRYCYCCCYCCCYCYCYCYCYSLLLLLLLLLLLPLLLLLLFVLYYFIFLTTTATDTGRRDKVLEHVVGDVDKTHDINMSLPRQRFGGGNPGLNP